MAAQHILGSTSHSQTLGLPRLVSVVVALTLCLLAPQTASADLLSVDVGKTGQTIQGGYLAFTRADATAGPTSEAYTIGFGIGGGGTATVTLDDNDSVLGARTVGDAGRTTVIHPVGQVAQDFIFTGAELTITLEDLAAGTYAWRSFHHDECCNQPIIDIRIDDADRTNRLAVNNLDQTTANVPGILATAPIMFRADGASDVVLRMTNSSAAGIFDGFQLTDDPPATAAVDFSLTGGDTQAGFDDFENVNGSNTGVSGAQEHWVFTDIANTGSARVRITPEAGTFAFRDRGDVTHALGDLAEDFVANAAGIDVELGSLKPGLYEITAYFHDRDNNQGDVDLSVTDPFNSETLVAPGVVQTFGATPSAIGSGTVTLYADGVNPVVLHIDEPDATSIVLAGIEAVAAENPTLRVEFGRVGGAGVINELQNGFEAFDRASSDAQIADGDSEIYATDLSASGSLTVTLESSTTTLGWRDRGDVFAELGDVGEDFVFSTGDLEVILEGLKRGRYAVTSYHQDSDNNQGTASLEADDAGGVGRLIFSGVTQATGTTVSPTAASYFILANGTDDVVLRFSDDSGSAVILNGFTVTFLVPEPSSLALLGLGLVFLGAGSRRRQRVG